MSKDSTATKPQSTPKRKRSALPKESDDPKVIHALVDQLCGDFEAKTINNLVLLLTAVGNPNRSRVENSNTLLTAVTRALTYSEEFQETINQIYDSAKPLRASALRLVT